MDRKLQLEMFDPLPCQEFALWKEQPGARQVLRRCYAVCAPYARRYRQSGIGVSVKLIWELVRDHIKQGRVRMRRRGMELGAWSGYTLNNNFTASLARHILEHRPEWSGLFDLREQWAGEKRSRKTRVIVVKRSA